MEHIQLDINDYIATIKLNRPDALNAFNYETLIELQQQVENVRANPEVRVVILTGTGNRAFSVGADLKERRNLTDEEVRRNLYKMGDVFNMIAELPQPTIAAINGFAFGGGLELALCCDFRFAADVAKVGLTETGLAIIPGAGGTQRLPRLIGEAKAMELILTAKRLSAIEAEQYGIVNEVCNEDTLFDTVIQFASKMLNNGPIALKQAKFAVKQGMNTDLHTGLHIERKAYEVLLPTKDRVEALQAFAEKRKPNFQGN
ncbi:enoyl-CoA hydratase/isomerase family protein [Cytobacillus kochii]|uniref:enoyl-CoA hydratase-related protein n=1 Tax=Cytobacillus kochii TaxID=859143 RepID=UPI001CD41E40|nr:enoyl-CoA hydratase-related protein [Cytobacillus kochii]MCA1027388.1 enoyl-CoA hydratase/isomerase family protein [Cytobacillus kochii]MDM5206896.1 enoyl-CoA hydratase-related protein [Cytobacillus kochii]